MNFSHLLHGAEILAQSGNPSIAGLEYDSRRVKPGDAFVAMRGEASDGNEFIDRAIAAMKWLGCKWRTDAAPWLD